MKMEQTGKKNAASAAAHPELEYLTNLHLQFFFTSDLNINTSSFYGLFAMGTSICCFSWP